MKRTGIRGQGSGVSLLLFLLATPLVAGPGAIPFADAVSSATDTFLPMAAVTVGCASAVPTAPPMAAASAPAMVDAAPAVTAASSAVTLSNAPPDTPAFLFIADETPLHRKLGVFEVRH